MSFSETDSIVPEEILVGCDIDYPPLSHLVKGKPAGFDIDLLELLEEQSGISFTVLPGNWSRVIEDLRTGRVDAVSGILKTEQRSQWFDFSLPYLTENYTIFSRRGAGIRGFGDMIGKRAAILRNDAAISTFFIPNRLEESLIFTESFTQAMELVAGNEADYTIAPYSLGRYLITSMKIEDEIHTSRTLFPVNYRIAVKKGNRELLFQINESIAALQQTGKLEELIRKKKIAPPHSVSTVPPSSPLLLVSGMGLIFILLVIHLARGFYRHGVAKALRDQEEKKTYLKALLEGVPYPLRWRDETFRIRGSNSRMETLFPQTSFPPPSGSPGDPEVPPGFDDFPEEMEKADRLTWSTGRLQEIRLQTASGGEAVRTYHYQSIPIGKNPQNTPGGVLGVLQDRTQEDLLKSSVESLSALLAQKEKQQQPLDLSSGLFNSIHLRRQLEEEAAHYGRYFKPFTIILFELHLGGVRTGDVIRKETDGKGQTMKRAGEILKSVLRRIDHVGRWDEETFLIILPQALAAEGRKVAGKLHKALEPLGDFRFALGEFHGQGVAALVEETRKILKAEEYEES